MSYPLKSIDVTRDTMIMTRLDEITKSLTDLKSEYSIMSKKLEELRTENSIMRKEILGNGLSDRTNSEEMGLLENKTLREIVEQTQLQVKQINSKMLDNKRQNEITKNTNQTTEVKQINAKMSEDEIQEEIAGITNCKSEKKLNEGEDKDIAKEFPVVEIQMKTNNNEKRKEITEKLKSMNEKEVDGIDEEESLEEFPVIEIERKTIQEERNWMKEKFKEIKEGTRIGDGETIRGTTVEEFSNSITFSVSSKTACTLKLSNFLDSALTDPEYHFWRGFRNSGPFEVAGKHQEIFSFLGDSGCCYFLSSFQISPILRLAIRCYINSDGNIALGIGFSPADVPTDLELENGLIAMPDEAPDVIINKQNSQIPQDLFINHENLLVRGQMTPGQRSIVHVEILEINPGNVSILSGNEVKRHIVDGESIKSQAVFQNSGPISRVPEDYGRFSCHIEIVNCLNVTLRDQGLFYFNCDKKNFVPAAVLPFHRERFFGADEANVEALFSYEIVSTDFAIVVALKVGPYFNSFAAAFVQINSEVATGREKFEALMDPNQWRTHDHRNYAIAGEGVQLIQMGNIRAEVQMTEEYQSLFKIRIFAV